MIVFTGLIRLNERIPCSPASKFVQVKTNTVAAKDLQKYKKRTRTLPMEHAEFEVWVRVDREGWKLLEYDGEEFEQYATLPCNTSEAGEKYRSLQTADERGETDE